MSGVRLVTEGLLVYILLSQNPLGRMAQFLGLYPETIREQMPMHWVKGMSVGVGGEWERWEHCINLLLLPWWLHEIHAHLFEISWHLVWKAVNLMVDSYILAISVIIWASGLLGSQNGVSKELRLKAFSTYAYSQSWMQVRNWKQIRWKTFGNTER